MNRISYIILGIASFLINFTLYGQSTENCFLDDFESKVAEIPRAVNAEKPADSASVIVTINEDTLGKISKYVFGNAIAAWFGSHEDPELIENTALFAPTLIRFPGGSWSNGYFFNGVPSDVPDSIYDGQTYNSTAGTADKLEFSGHDGTEDWVTTTDQYYALRESTDVNEGLITINYGYARYGTSDDPVAKAAHLAADWVRYDARRTKFWEIGNENGGPWEYGWMIDTALNKDGQPQIITGELYGQHFKVFVDSMRNAAAQIGATTYIGAQLVIYGESSWNFVDRDWNEGVFNEVGDYADYYVIHCYFDNSADIRSVLMSPRDLTDFMDFLKQDFIDKEAYPKPITVTEYNVTPCWGNVACEEREMSTSYINGIEAVVCMCEMIKNNYGLGARWLLEELFEAYGSNSNSPHAEFYYLAYLPNFYGDHAISTTSSDSDIFSYASKYSSGETAMIIINIGTDDEVIKIGSDSIGVGGKYYIYSFTGGTEADYSKDVYINGEGPSTNHWGPYDQLFNIRANSYTIDTIDNEIKFTSPGRSVQMIMIEGVRNIDSYNLYQNDPNPFSTITNIGYQLPVSSFVTLKLFDILGREVETLFNEHQNAGVHSVTFDASHLTSGIYFYRIEARTYHDTKKLLLLK